jgi:hypothetical protein
MIFLKFRFVLAASTAMILSLAPIAQAQTTPTTPTVTPIVQTATGTAGAGVFGTTGDTINGAFNNGSTSGVANASDLVNASVAANSTATGTSSQQIAATAVESKASTVIGTTASTVGTIATNLTLTGTAEQGNYTGLGDTINYANSGSKSSGTFTGSDATTTPLQGIGGAIANGESTGTLTGVGTNNVASTTTTTSSSTASSAITAGVAGELATTPTVSSGVSGTGLANSRIIAGDSTCATNCAVAYNAGGATYGITNPAGAAASGSLLIDGAGNTAINTTKNSANLSASSAVTATATAK